MKFNCGNNTVLRRSYLDDKNSCTKDILVLDQEPRHISTNIPENLWGRGKICEVEIWSFHAIKYKQSIEYHLKTLPFLMDLHPQNVFCPYGIMQIWIKISTNGIFMQVTDLMCIRILCPYLTHSTMIDQLTWRKGCSNSDDNDDKMIMMITW